MSKNEFKGKSIRTGITINVLKGLLNYYKEIYKNEENEEHIKEQHAKNLKDISDVICYIENKKVNFQYIQ